MMRFLVKDILRQLLSMGFSLERGDFEAAW